MSTNMTFSIIFFNLIKCSPAKYADINNNGGEALFFTHSSDIPFCILSLSLRKRLRSRTCRKSNFSLL